MIIHGTAEHGFAIAKAIGVMFNPVCDVSIVRVEDGQLLGGALYQGYTGASIRIHVVGFHPRWIDRDALWMAFHYPFDQLGCTKVIGFVPSINLKALDFNRKLGFKEEARISDVFRGADLVIMSMRREDCRWLERGRRHGILLQGAGTASPGHEWSGQRGQRHWYDEHGHSQGYARLGENAVRAE